MPVHVNMLLILTYVITHNISGSHFSDLLTLIGLHSMHIHPDLKSLFHLKKYFADMKSPIKKNKQFYCKFCFNVIDYDVLTCPNTFCLKDLFDVKSKAYFIELSIQRQIQNFFNKDGFVDFLQNRFSRVKNIQMELKTSMMETYIKSYQIEIGLFLPNTHIM